MNYRDCYQGEGGVNELCALHFQEETEVDPIQTNWLPPFIHHLKFHFLDINRALVVAFVRIHARRFVARLRAAKRVLTVLNLDPTQNLRS